MSKLSSLLLSTFLVPGLALAAGGELSSSIPPDAGLKIPNAHLVARGQGTLYRGQAPGAQIGELRKMGVTRVLIFKNETANEVHEEVAALQQLGYTSKQIAVIPFRWKDIPAFPEACTQTLQALRLLHATYTAPGQTTYFHCTLGEDRTGYLAGLFRITEQGWNPRQAFDQEMCENGYEAGDPQKPKKIVDVLRRDFTPLYLKMAVLIGTALKNGEKLTPELCNREADATRVLEASPRLAPASYICPASSKVKKP